MSDATGSLSGLCHWQPEWSESESESVRQAHLRAGKTFKKPFFGLFWVNKGFSIKFAPPKPLFFRFAPLKPLFFKFASPEPL